MQQQQQLENIESATAVVAGLEQSGAGNQRKSFWRGLLDFLGSNPKMTVGLVILFIFLLVGVLGPVFFHQKENPFDNPVYQAPNAQYWLGTTSRGEDVFVQLLAGTGHSLFIGFTVAIVATILSVVFGLTAGYFGGIVDDFLSLFINIFIILPGLPLAIVLASFLPFKGSWSIILVLCLTSWSWGARVLRSQTMTLRRREFVVAARSVGEPAWRIIFFEILPNVVALVASSFVGTLIYALLSEIALEFLGLGDLSQPSWGMMLYWAQTMQALLSGTWWWFVPPGLGMAILGAGLTLINFGIDELANPRLRNEGRRFKQIKAQKAVA